MYSNCRQKDDNGYFVQISHVHIMFRLCLKLHPYVSIWEFHLCGSSLLFYTKIKETGCL